MIKTISLSISLSVTAMKNLQKLTSIENLRRFSDRSNPYGMGASESVCLLNTHAKNERCSATEHGFLRKQNKPNTVNSNEKERFFSESLLVKTYFFHSHPFSDMIFTCAERIELKNDS